MSRGTRELSPGRPDTFRLQDYHLLWLAFPGAFDCTADLITSRVAPETAPQPRPYCYGRFGLFRVRSPLLTESRLISLPAGTEMFHFPAFASIRPMNSAHDDRALPRSGFPIRKPPDQSLLSGSPGLFAASHVLRRLLAPRHPPCALSSLTMLATGHAVGNALVANRLGELPRACSLLTDYPSRLSKTEPGIGPRIRLEFEIASRRLSLACARLAPRAWS